MTYILSIMLLLYCCYGLSFILFFFFFKQKTAYEMRISDWSSDCALPILDRVSDFDEFLADVPLGIEHQEVKALAGEVYVVARHRLGRAFLDPLHDGRISLGAAGRNELNGSHPNRMVDGEPAARPAPAQIGRASCRERGGQSAPRPAAPP